jgi:hypothetical protein
MRGVMNARCWTRVGPSPEFHRFHMLTDAWRYHGGARDLRLDLLRGFCMVAMVIDHIGAHTGATGSWLYAFTGGNQFFVSAAEGFIFVSGLITGVINGGVTAGHGLGRVVMRILYRGWMLYCVTVLLTFAFVLVLLGLRYPGAPHVEAKGIPAWVIGVLTLHRTYYLTDIIFTYTILFFAAGLAVTLIGHGYTRWVLIGSWVIWLLWQFFPREAELPWAVVDGGAFHFSAWQALFFTALIIGYHRRAIGAWLSWVRPEAVLVVSSILLLLCIELHRTQLRPLATLLPGISQGQLTLQFLDKADVRVGRLLVFAVVAAFAWGVTTLAWAPVQRAFGWLMLPLGQRSLTAYSVHVFVVAVLGWVTVNLWQVPPQSIGANSMVQVLGVAMVWASVRAAPRLTSLAHRWDELEHRLLAEVEHVLTLTIPRH